MPDRSSEVVRPEQANTEIGTGGFKDCSVGRLPISWYMPKRMSSLIEAHAKLHRNHSFELLVASWLMDAGGHVFWPLLDAAHAVDLIVLDGPKSYRLQVKTVESQELNQVVKNCWKKRHLDYVIYFARSSNWGYVSGFRNESKTSG